MRNAVLLLLLVPTLAFADKEFAEPSDGDSWDCSKDAVVTVNYSKAAFTLTGTCTEVTINGTSLKLTAENVDKLGVNGAKNVVTTTELGSVAINGNSNKVTWKKAKTGKKPKVSTNGRGNSVKKA